MSDKVWKQRERGVARFFGARGRTPLSGGNSGHTRSDTLHERLFIEHKHRVRHAIINLWDRIKPLAMKEGKAPVVTLSVKGRPGFWIMVHSSHLGIVAKEIAKRRIDHDHTSTDA